MTKLEMMRKSNIEYVKLNRRIDLIAHGQGTRDANVDKILIQLNAMTNRIERLEKLESQKHPQHPSTSRWGESPQPTVLNRIEMLEGQTKRSESDINLTHMHLGDNTCKIETLKKEFNEHLGLTELYPSTTPSRHRLSWSGEEDRELARCFIAFVSRQASNHRRNNKAITSRLKKHLEEGF